MNDRPPIFVPSPEEVAATSLSDFMRRCGERTGGTFGSYAEFEAFAIEESRTFWRLLLEWSGLPHDGDPGRVCVGDACETAQFFPNVRLNYAECLLRLRDEDDAARPALRSCRPERETELLSRGELRRRVETLAAALEACGVGPGTRVALIAHNDAEAAVAMLACAALGALICLTSTELAAFATIARLERMRPELIFCHLRSPYPDVEAQLRERLREVAAALPSVRRIVVLDGAEPAEPSPAKPDVVFETLGALCARAPDVRTPWRRFPFNHPLFVLFTSGTTGAPKCLVQGAGGMLLQNFKEMSLHLDVRPMDRVFFQTSAGWVIWLELIANLALGAEVVLNSRPVHAPQTLWEIVGEESVTMFLTSPAFLQLCEASGYRPREEVRLDALRSLMAAGSVLYAAQQDWASASVKPLPIRSVYGSTDIAACFTLPSPNLPVYAGECQARSLGLDIRAARKGELGLPAPIGEVVCVNPFPSRPLGFLDDGPGFHETYFMKNPGSWTQGDFIEFTSHGGAFLHGRCDGVLNVRGVRIGPVEIYDAVKFVPEVAACLAVAQDRPDAPGGTRLILLVVLGGGLTLGEELRERIRNAIWRRASSVHLPDAIAQVAELPITHNGKLSERAASDAVSGREAVNRDALRNPGCLAAIASHPALEAQAAPAPAASPTPRSLEEVLTSAWTRAFGGQAVGRDDNFFEIGGDSLIAMRILFTLRKELNVNAPITEIFRAPTIAALARSLAARAAVAAPDRHLSPVRLKEGGDAPPLFIISGVDGSVMKLRQLAMAVDYRGPVYGLQARGVSGEAEPLSDFAAMARFYIEAAQSIQPHGPYAIAGFSLGGLAALETARAFREAGEGVSCLMLLDPPLDERWWPLPLWLATLVRRAGLHGGRSISRLGRGGWRYAAKRAFGLARHVRRRYSRGAQARAPSFEPDLPPLLQAVHDRALEAVAVYTPRFYDGALTLLVATKGIYEGCAAGRLWSRFAAEVRVESVPGDHRSMIMAPHHHALAEAIARSLASAEGSSSEPARTATTAPDGRARPGVGPAPATA